jgi:glycosyltransferase involved in cell wall biosynthesis
VNEPRVSVLMAARNHEEYAEDAARSVLDQDYERLELIAVDDASTDRTAHVLEQCLADTPKGRMRVVRHERQEGIAETRAHALSLASGELIGVLDSDDLWLPGKLPPQVELLAAEPHVGLVHGEFETFDSSSGEAVQWGERTWDREADPLVELVRIGCFIMTGTVLMRRAAIEQRGVGFVNPGYASYDDYLLFLTIALDWRIAHEDRLVMRYRRHAGNLTNVLFSGNLARARANLLELFVSMFPEAKDRLGGELRRTLSALLVRAAVQERGRSNTRALRWALSAFRQDPRTAMRASAQAVRQRAAAARSG